MRRKALFPADLGGVGEGTDYFRKFLKETGIKEKQQNKAVLIVEEAINTLVSRAEEDVKYSLTIKKLLGTVSVEIKVSGEEFDMRAALAGATADVTGLAGVEDTGVETNEVLRNILLSAFSDDLKYSHGNGVNSVRMTVIRSEHRFLYVTLGAMILAVIIGLLLSSAGNADFNQGLVTFVLSPVNTMFMSALKMVVAPVVFFSIISCIVQFTELSELGRIGGKIFGLYACTTILAILIGIGAYYIFTPGSGISVAGAQAVSSISTEGVSISILDTVINIVPDNLFKPFIDSNMLQLIFLAILLGIAVGMIGKYSKILIGIIQALNELFLKVTSIIIKVMPIAIFCSIAKMMLEMGIGTIISVMGILGTYLAGLLGMMILYCILLILFGWVNPFKFIKNYVGTMLQVFSMNSSSASIPINMETCDKKLGIDSKIYSLSIPLGATVNMDGTCIRLGVFSLALARVYGIEISGAMLVSLIISIFVMSVGTPGIPGAGIVTLSVLLAAIGVPIEAVSIVMGIDALVGMSSTMSNCLGDVVVTTIVARSEKMIDMSRW
ncbi:MAG: cation:dicarboxylase symporter family transporter [Lachnospiraceae bacterium]|nr:cation:dicarboxylase symporter family transporter [Lachnospiraceae bacterium]